MNADDSRPFTVKQAVQYTDIDGSTKSIAPGQHRIVPVWAQGVPTGESELECWIVKESTGAGEEIEHDVDAETLESWRAADRAEFG